MWRRPLLFVFRRQLWVLAASNRSAPAGCDCSQSWEGPFDHRRRRYALRSWWLHIGNLQKVGAFALASALRWHQRGRRPCQQLGDWHLRRPKTGLYAIQHFLESNWDNIYYVHSLKSHVAHLKYSAPNCQNCAHPNKSCLLLWLADHEHDVEQLCILQTRRLQIEEHSAKVFGQLIVVLELIADRVEQRRRRSHMSCARKLK